MTPTLIAPKRDPLNTVGNFLIGLAALGLVLWCAI